MRSVWKWVVRAIALLLCTGTMAQTSFEDLTVGSVVSGEMRLGRFAKPLPLPQGEWQVAARRTWDVKLDNGQTVPRQFFTLKNNVPGSPIAAMVLVFTPPTATNVNWTNDKCESKNPRDLVDDFGGSATDLLYLCAKVFTYTDFRKTVETSAGGTDAWRKANLPALAPYAQDLPQRALTLMLTGSLFKGMQVTYNLYIHRTSDLQTDPDYASQVRAWTHLTGLMLRDVFEGKAGSFTQPPVGQGAAPAVASQAATSLADVEPAKVRAEEAAAQEALQLQRDREKFEAERIKLEREKTAFEQQKLAAQREHDQKLARERADLLARSKALCLRAFNSASNEVALRQFIDDFPADDCGQQAAARQKLADFDDRRQKALKDSRDGKERERQTRQAQIQSLLGSTVQFQETFKYCVSPSAGSACQPVAYQFRLKGKIFDVDLRRGDGILVEVTEVASLGAAEGAQSLPGDRARDLAEGAFRQKMQGTRIWRSKAELGLVF